MVAKRGAAVNRAHTRLQCVAPRIQDRIGQRAVPPHQQERLFPQVLTQMMTPLTSPVRAQQSVSRTRASVAAAPRAPARPRLHDSPVGSGSAFAALRCGIQGGGHTLSSDDATALQIHDCVRVCTREDIGAWASGGSRTILTEVDAAVNAPAEPHRKVRLASALTGLAPPPAAAAAAFAFDRAPPRPPRPPEAATPPAAEGEAAAAAAATSS